MEYYIRKISRKRYLKDSFDDIEFNVFSRDLKSANNSISLWKISGDDEITLKSSLNDALLILSLMGEKIDSTEYVCIPSELLKDFNIEYCPSEANTSVKNGCKMHYNITNLKINDFMKFINIIYNLVNDKINACNYNVDVVNKIIPNQIKKQVFQAIESNLLDFNKMDKKMMIFLNGLDNNKCPKPSCSCENKLCNYFEACKNKNIELTGCV